jgi:hypothetical protein
VGLTFSGAPAPDARYLASDRTSIAAGTSTTSAGVAITPPPSLQNISGSGGTCGAGACMWTSTLGGGPPGVVFIQPFYRAN